MRRLARVGLAALVVVLSVSLGVIAATPAHAFDKPTPVAVPPGNGGGAGSLSGTPTIGGPATVDPPGPKPPRIDALGLALAGVGAYNGTCWVLGQLFTGGSCGSFTVLGLTFGSEGDNGSFSAPGGAFTVPTTYAGGFNPVTFGSIALAATPRTTVLNYQTAGGTGSCRVYKNWTGPGFLSVNAKIGPQIHINDGWTGELGNCAQGSDSTVQHAISGFQVLEGSTVLGEVWYDLGVGSPWTVEYTRECVRPDGSEFTVEASVPFTPAAGGAVPGVSDAQLPACSAVEDGSWQKNFHVEGGRDTVEGPEVTVDYPTFSEQAQTDYPLCTNANGPSGGCWLDLQKAGKSCFSDGVYCAGWLQNVARWQMSCEWGPYVVAMEYCQQAYGTKFDTQAQPSPSSSPTVGAPTLPTTGPNPESPPVDPEVETDPDSRSCWGEGWSMNPVSWVYVPVKCALIWAFVPTAPPSFSDVTVDVPAGWLPGGEAFDTDTSCGVITVPAINFGPMVGSLGPETLVNTCPAPWPLVRNVTYYGVLAVLSLSAARRLFNALMEALGMAVDYTTPDTPTGPSKFS